MAHVSRAVNIMDSRATVSIQHGHRIPLRNHMYFDPYKGGCIVISNIDRSSYGLWRPHCNCDPIFHLLNAVE